MGNTTAGPAKATPLHPLYTDPTTAALSQAAEDALQNAGRARLLLLRNTIEYVAALIRQDLPEAAAVTIDTAEAELVDVIDGDGRTIWYAPASAGSLLRDGIADDIGALLADAMPYGGLDEAGWEVADRGEPFRRVLLPTGQVLRRGIAAIAIPTRRGMVTVHAEYTPGGTPAFQVTGPNSMWSRETRDRIRAAIVNSGQEWKPGLMQVTSNWPISLGGAGADLAIACTALAAAGAFSPVALHEAVLLGELGLDGYLRQVTDLRHTATAAAATACRTVIVPAQQAPYVHGLGLDLDVIGVRHLPEAVAELKRLAPEA
ncbi:magnesium chelatase domain-containing protein [Streptomyces sp. DH12]|uniref:magnesium chelatase domain-containing protein n=1 Tax=Streptomyces sp. DH12 TaxID=2857010 RepID=UPI001E341860|nr:magnesium chelatase domain-containing protein [Streptomyces sp. DH12]